MFVKKVLKIVLVLSLIVSLFSCGSKVNGQLANNNLPIPGSTQGTVLTNIVNNDNAKLASDKQQTYDEINKKYKDLHLKYSKHREDFSSDVVFANFRNVKVGNIKEGVLYRGASSIDNSYGRAKYVDKLISEVGVKFDVDLTDDDKKKTFFKKRFCFKLF